MRKVVSVFTLLQCYRGILVVVTHISDDVHIVICYKALIFYMKKKSEYV